jgi:alkylhydroperoxidase/carboxymuconolactone decarboxylase family protein YurZ
LSTGFAQGDGFEVGVASAGVAVSDDQPVLNTIAEMTALWVARGTLDAREHMLARLAALVAVDAPTVSYVLHFEPAAEVGLTVEDTRGLLVAVAPIVGTARVASAAGKLTTCRCYSSLVGRACALYSSRW